LADSTTYTTGGTVQAGGGVYLTRKSDEELLGLCREGAFAFVLAARQTGKSSLMTHAVERLLEEGMRSAVVDLNSLGAQLSAEEWYLGFLTEVESQLQLRTSASTWWRANTQLGMTQRLTCFLRDVLLEEVKERVVLFVDEIDTTLSLDFTDDFFACIRSLYNARAQHPALERLSFVLLGVATPGDLVKDPARTPFNLGRRVELTDFEFSEARPLAAGLGPEPAVGEQVLRWVMEWTGGHPYLTQRVCQEIASVSATTRFQVAEVIERLFLGEKSFEDNNLQFVRDMLTKRAPDVAETLRIYRQVRYGTRPVRDEEQSLAKSHLKLAGIVRRDGEHLQVRNAIYQAVFNKTWIREYLPGWSRLLQREVLQRAAVVVASVGFIALAPLTVQLWRKVSEAERARAATEVERQKAVENASKARDLKEKLGDELSKAQEQNRRLEQLRDQLQEELALASAKNAGLSRSLDEVDAARKVADQRTTELEEAQQKTEEDRTQLRVERLLFLTKSTTDHQLAALLLAEALQLQARPEIVGQLAEHLASLSDASSGTAAVHVGDTGSLRSPAHLWPRKLNERYLVEGSGSVAFSPDGKRLATTTGDAATRIWDAVSGKGLKRLTGSTGPLAFSPNGRMLITAGTDDLVRIWNTDPWSIASLFQHEGRVRTVAFNPHGDRVATAGSDEAVRLWETASGKPLKTLPQKGECHALAFSPDGARVGAAGDDNQASIWDATSGARLVSLPHLGIVRSLAFSPRGTMIATAGDDRVANLWEANTGRRLGMLQHESPVRSVSFSPDEKWVLTTSGDKEAALWDVASGKVVQRFRHEGSVLGAAFSPDGREVITTGSEQMARIWDASSGRLLASFHRTGPVHVAMFSPDRKLVFIAGDDSSLLTPWRPDDLLGTVCSVVERNLSPDEWAKVAPDESYRSFCAGLPSGI